MPAQLIPADLIARAQIIDGLRQLADYLDHHPDIPVNEYSWDLGTYPIVFRVVLGEHVGVAVGGHDG